MRAVAVGATAGLVGSFIATWFLRTLLFQVPAGDPFTFEIALVLLIAFVLLACYIPARRATRVDPMVALRYE